MSTAILLVLAMVAGACNTEYPNSTFNHTTEFNTAIDAVWDRLLFWGTIVFVGVEVALLYVIVRFRRSGGASRETKPIHGSTKLEILWTAIPAVILVAIAIPTVRTIFATQAKAAPDALQIEVVGHQWWWEFRYPEYGITTANELYLPKGRTVNFALTTVDVLHSFWIPQLGGKRDLITNKTNYLWFTPNADIATDAFNGFCAEYCGSSHANMKFRTYTVEPEEFERWAAHQARPAVFPATPAVPAVPSGAGVVLQEASTAAPSDSTAAPATPALEPYWFPKEKLPAHVIPTTKLPDGLTFDEALLAQGDAERGRELYSRSSCIGCHAIAGNPMSMSKVGPNLTHVATRHTLASGLYPNDAKHLALWIKNAPRMKPGSLMPTIGAGERDPVRKTVMSAAMGGLTDAQIADIVAYLQALQ
ncbi:MAG TPA: cytochrome c oxidase subunit II [Gemmatimonadaceae bacterium]|nr:cytochrome c oxidase subunit II [Gemmatimonadaceae bacterium]